MDQAVGILAKEFVDLITTIEWWVKYDAPYIVLDVSSTLSLLHTFIHLLSIFFDFRVLLLGLLVLEGGLFSGQSPHALRSGVFEALTSYMVLFGFLD